MTQQIKVIAVVAMMVVSSFGSSIVSMENSVQRTERHIERVTSRYNRRMNQNSAPTYQQDLTRKYDAKMEKFSNRVDNKTADIHEEIEAIKRYITF